MNVSWQLWAGIGIGWMVGLTAGYNQAIAAMQKVVDLIIERKG